MKHRFSGFVLSAGVLALFFFAPQSLFAQNATTQNININASALAPKAEIAISPTTGSFWEGSTFGVSVFINTKGNSINTVELFVNFDPTKLQIIQPSSDKSIIGVWLEPPSYSNTKGTAKLSGIIPNGINTDSGLIATITFKAIAPGSANVSISPATSALLNDGNGTDVVLSFNRVDYVIVPRPPDGPAVFSQTHQFEDRWYNNNAPLLAWDKDSGVTGFSYILDNKPFTVPDNTIISTDTIKSYTYLTDGLWYFHIKALKQGVWGATTHFLIRVDTTPPAEFTPTIEYLTSSTTERGMISFFTTDNLSGIDHYEVGIIEKSAAPTESPVFVQTESPFQLPVNVSDNIRVIVRAMDRAGNVRDESADAQPPAASPGLVSNNNLVLILLVIIGLIILLTLFHYLFGHKIIHKLKAAFKLAEKEEVEEELEAVKEKLEKLEPASNSPETPAQNVPPAGQPEMPPPPRPLG